LTGIYGVDKRVVAEAAYEALKRFASVMQGKKSRSLFTILFVNIDAETTDVFYHTLDYLHNGTPYPKGKKISPNKTWSGKMQRGGVDNQNSKKYHSWSQNVHGEQKDSPVRNERFSNGHGYQQGNQRVSGAESHQDNKISETVESEQESANVFVSKTKQKIISSPLRGSMKEPEGRGLVSPSKKLDKVCSWLSAGVDSVQVVCVICMDSITNPKVL